MLKHCDEGEEDVGYYIHTASGCSFLGDVTLVCVLLSIVYFWHASCTYRERFMALVCPLLSIWRQSNAIKSPCWFTKPQGNYFFLSFTFCYRRVWSLLFGMERIQDRCSSSLSDLVPGWLVISRHNHHSERLETNRQNLAWIKLMSGQKYWSHACLRVMYTRSSTSRRLYFFPVWQLLKKQSPASLSLFLSYRLSLCLSAFPFYSASLIFFVPHFFLPLLPFFPFPLFLSPILSLFSPSVSPSFFLYPPPPPTSLPYSLSSQRQNELPHRNNDDVKRIVFRLWCQLPPLPPLTPPPPPPTPQIQQKN